MIQIRCKHHILFTLIILLAFYSTGCSFNKAKKEIEEYAENMENLEAQVNIPKVETKVEYPLFDSPQQSGPVTNLPWFDNEKFIEAREKNNTNVLLAAYCTVLKDPLPGEEYNVHLAADSLAGTLVLPGEIFSQNNTIGPYTESRGYKKGPTYMGSQITTTVGGGVCKIASTLYNVAILSNLQIIERRNHSMPVPYVPYGQDATVAYGLVDFKFKNNTDFPILIWAQGIENKLYMAFYGSEKPPKVEWHHRFLERKEAPKEYRVNPALKQGEEKILIEGMEGAKVESYITIEYPDGRTEEKNLGISFYRPMPYLIETNR